MDPVSTLRLVGGSGVGAGSSAQNDIRSRTLAPPPPPHKLTGPDGAKASDSQLKEASEQFEAIFLRQLLRDLRKTATIDGENSSMTGIYNEMLDEHLANQLARAGGIGLAEVIRTYAERGAR